MAKAGGLYRIFWNRFNQNYFDMFGSLLVSDCSFSMMEYQPISALLWASSWMPLVGCDGFNVRGYATPEMIFAGVSVAAASVSEFRGSLNLHVNRSISVARYVLLLVEVILNTYGKL